MVQKVNGLVPETGSWLEGELVFVSRLLADYADVASAKELALGLTDADVKFRAAAEDLQSEGTIVILENDGTTVFAALGYAGEAPAGWAVGSFTVA